MSIDRTPGRDAFFQPSGRTDIAAKETLAKKWTKTEHRSHVLILRLNSDERSSFVNCIMIGVSVVSLLQPRTQKVTVKVTQFALKLFTDGGIVEPN